MKKKLFILGLFTAGIVAAYVFYRAEHPSAVASTTPIPVVAQIVQRQDFPVVLEALGQVNAYNSVTIKARVDGEIKRVDFQEGQDVKQGDLLIEIDSRPFEAILDQNIAKKTQDEANLANARTDLTRYSTLLHQNFASRQQYDTQFALVASEEAQVQADQAAVEAAQIQLGFTKIYAPLSGRVGYRLVDQGNMVQASAQTGLLVINQYQPIAVTFTLPEAQMDEITRLQQAGSTKISVFTSNGTLLAQNGVLEAVDNHVDSLSGTITLKVKFANKNNNLTPGFAVVVHILTGVDKNVPVIPSFAVQRGERGFYVYVIDNQDNVTPRTIHVLHQSAQFVSISQGLSGGERIVTEGQVRLRPGTHVVAE